jgi:hypothetical protein
LIPMNHLGDRGLPPAIESLNISRGAGANGRAPIVAGGDAQRASGRMKVNLAPPAEDSAQIFPPWASTIPLAM